MERRDRGVEHLVLAVATMALAAAACSGRAGSAGPMDARGVDAAAGADAAVPVEAEPVSEATPAAAASEEAAPPAAPPDLLRCPLSLRAYELGEPGDGAPSAPAVAGDGFVVAWTRPRADGADLVVARLAGDGTLGPERVVRSGVHASTPPLVAAEGRLSVVAIVGTSAEALPLDPATAEPLAGAPAVALPAVPMELVLGPRGLVGLALDRRSVRIFRGIGGEAAPDLRFPVSGEIAEPREQLLASGPATDLLLLRRGRAVDAAALAPSASRPPRPLGLFSGAGHDWTEASVAAGPRGFVVARTGPEIGDLSLYRFDLEGRPVGEPVPLVASGEERVARYPRAAALGEGWAVTSWDGTGPTLRRADGEGRPIDEAVPIRSGDERGGHTDARMAAGPGALAVTWTVEPPRMHHGFPEEDPRRPGPRIGLLTCSLAGP